MPNTGKTTANKIQFFIDDINNVEREITASCNECSQLGLENDSPDATAYSDGQSNVLLGLPKGDIELGGTFDNTALIGAHTVLQPLRGSMAQTYTFTAKVGIRAAAGSGDPKWSGEYYVSKYQVIPGGPNDTLKWKATLKPAGSAVGAWDTI